MHSSAFSYLDRDITFASICTLSPTVISLPISPTDHFPIICSLQITNCPTSPITKYLTRAIRAIKYWIMSRHSFFSSYYSPSLNIYSTSLLFSVFNLSLPSLTLKTYPTGFLTNSCLLILQKLTCSSLAYNNSLNSMILPFIYITISYTRLLILLAILVLSLIKSVFCITHL